MLASSPLPVLPLYYLGGGWMEGVVINYRRGRRTMRGNQIIIEVPGVDTREKAAGLIGKKVIVRAGNKRIVGVVSGIHGNNGKVRARFDTGIPGQVIGGRVEIVG